VNHSTVKVKIDKRYYDIDRDIAPLVKVLNKSGIVTIQSCQEREPGLAWIVFGGSGDVEEFLTIAQKKYKPRLETWDEGDDGQVSIRVNLYVLFPKKDIPELAERFRLHLSRSKEHRGGQ
jgi:hypothetical protein